MNWCASSCMLETLVLTPIWLFRPCLKPGWSSRSCRACCSYWRYRPSWQHRARPIADLFFSGTHPPNPKAASACIYVACRYITWCFVFVSRFSTSLPRLTKVPWRSSPPWSWSRKGRRWAPQRLPFSPSLGSGPSRMVWSSSPSTMMDLCSAPRFWTLLRMIW